MRDPIAPNPIFQKIYTENSIDPLSPWKEKILDQRIYQISINFFKFLAHCALCIFDYKYRIVSSLTYDYKKYDLFRLELQKVLKHT